MRYVTWIPGVLVLLALAIFGLERAASERVEVVELHTQDDSGELVTTRLWVVDHDGHAWLRGDDRSGWVQRLKQQPVIELTRGGERASYQWQIHADQTATINALMRDKYTWGDQVISVLVGSRDAANAIALQPVSDPDI